MMMKRFLCALLCAAAIMTTALPALAGVPDHVPKMTPNPQQSGYSPSAAGASSTKKNAGTSGSGVHNAMGEEGYKPPDGSRDRPYLVPLSGTDSSAVLTIARLFNRTAAKYYVTTTDGHVFLITNKDGSYTIKKTN